MFEYTFADNQSNVWNAGVVPRNPPSSIALAVSEQSQGYGRPPYGDVLRAMVGGFMFRPKLLPCAYAVGDTNTFSPGGRTIRVIGHRPATLIYSWARDYSYYGDLFHTFTEVLGQRKKLTPWSTTKVYGEKGVLHAQLNGKSRHVRSVESLLYNDGDTTASVYGYDFGAFTESPTHWVYGQSVGATSILASWASQTYPYTLGANNRVEPQGYFDVNIEGLLEYVNRSDVEFHNTYYYNGSNNYITTRYSDAVWEPSEFSMNGRIPASHGATASMILGTLSYHLFFFGSKLIGSTPENPGHVQDLVADYDCKITLYHQRLGDQPSLQSQDTILAKFSADTDGYVRVGGGTPFTNWTIPNYERDFIEPFIFVSNTSARVAASYPLGDGIPSNLDNFLKDTHPFVTVGPRRGSKLNQFEVAVREELPNIRPMCIKSFSAAVSNYEDVIRTNHIETLSDLGGLFRVLPDLRNVPRVIGLLVERRFAAAVDATLDLLTDTDLALSFGFRPSAEAVEEAISVASRVQRRLESLEALPSVSYGDFEYTFPQGTFGVDQASIKVRTKVSFQQGPTALAGILLASAALGVQPNLHNFWEAIPFSFAVDWFTGLSSRFENVDSYLKGMVYDIHYCVHSYTIVATIDEQYLSTHELGIVDDPITATLYLREVSTFPAPIRHSKFDFDSPTRHPDSGIVGSLVYQLLH